MNYFRQYNANILYSVFTNMATETYIGILVGGGGLDVLFIYHSIFIIIAFHHKRKTLKLSYVKSDCNQSPLY